MSQVNTPLGPGKIVASETVRGRTQVQVEGAGYKKWFFADEIRAEFVDQPKFTEDNEDLSTALPYNPAPQYPAVFDSGESTIQPNHEIDEDLRTSPADSVDFTEAPELVYPGPNPELFDDEPLATEPQFTDTIIPDYINHASRADDWATRNADKFVALTAEKDELQRRLENDASGLARSLRHAHTTIAEADPHIADYKLLLEVDADLREAAWSDVRKKGLRLRREGNIEVIGSTPESIYAYVMGDTGVYETIVVRGNVYNASQSITEWSCNCLWGQNAFDRMTYVGRLCSHAYALYLEMQSRSNRKKSTKKEADALLTTEPWRMSPDLQVDDTEHPVEVVDLQEDERVDLLNFSPVTGSTEESVAIDLLYELRDMIDDPDAEQNEKLRNDEISDTVEELRDLGYDADNLVAMVRQGSFPDDLEVFRLPHEPFAGSGPVDHPVFTTSDDYVDLVERPHLVEVDEHKALDDHITVAANVEDSTDDADSRSWLMEGMARTAGRVFSPQEQADLINEASADGGNPLDELDLRGTHYLM